MTLGHQAMVHRYLHTEYPSEWKPRGVVSIERVAFEDSPLHAGVDVHVVMSRWGKFYRWKGQIPRLVAERGNVAECVEQCVDAAVDALWLGKAEEVAR